MSVLWQWIFAVIGLVAFIMAVPSLLVLLYGAPKIIFNFQVDTIDDSFHLSCLFRNEPITKGIIRFLNIRRDTAQDVSAKFEICEKETKKVICPLMSTDIRIQREELKERVSLPASIVPARIFIAWFKKEHNAVYVNKEQCQVLLTGQYILRVELCTGDRIWNTSHEFIVRDDFPYVVLD